MAILLKFFELIKLEKWLLLGCRVCCGNSKHGCLGNLSSCVCGLNDNERLIYPSLFVKASPNFVNIRPMMF